MQWEDTTEKYTSTRERKSLVDLVRCERCAVGIHPACAVNYSEWSGKVGEPGGFLVSGNKNASGVFTRQPAGGVNANRAYAPKT